MRLASETSQRFSDYFPGVSVAFARFRTAPSLYIHVDRKATFYVAQTLGIDPKIAEKCAGLPKIKGGFFSRARNGKIGFIQNIT